jgi:hypothetical protein
MIVFHLPEFSVEVIDRNGLVHCKDTVDVVEISCW